MLVDLPSLVFTEFTLFMDEALMKSDSSEIVRIQRDLGHPLELHVRLEETISGIVEREQGLRGEMRHRGFLLRSRLRELEEEAAATVGLKKELEDANTMVAKLQESWGREKEDVQNRMASIEAKHHEELVSELEKKDQVRELLLVELRHQHRDSEQAWREHQDQLDREIRRLHVSGESEKLKLRQDLLDEFERERKGIQEETEKNRKAEKEAMDTALEEERRGARRQLERVEREHLKREEDLEGQLEQAREIAVAAEANLQEQQRKEQELLDRLEQARRQTKETESKLQQQLGEEQKEREEERERFRVAIKAERALGRKESHDRFIEKELLTRGVRKDTQEIRGDIKKELKMKTEEKREEWDSDVARD